MRDVTATDHPEWGWKMQKRNESRMVKANGKDSGQGMTEYIIIVALIAISAIGVTTVFGGNVRALMGTSANSLAGDQNGSPPTQRASSSSMRAPTLKTFGQQN